MKLKRLKIYFDFVFWSATLIKDVANAAGEICLTIDRIRRRKRKRPINPGDRK